MPVLWVFGLHLSILTALGPVCAHPPVAVYRQDKVPEGQRKRVDTLYGILEAKVSHINFNTQLLECVTSNDVTSMRTMANQGYLRAQILLGRCYLEGTVVRGSDQEAVSWFYKAAQQGHPMAQFHLGWCGIN